MARNNDRDRKRTTKDTRPRARQKICIFCRDHVEWIDYKDVNLLRRFMSDRGKIRARRVTGNCAQHQRDVAVAIKTAREVALLPYTQRTVSERGPGRGSRSGGARDAQAPAPEVEAPADEEVDGGSGEVEPDLEDAGAQA
jgi:small subunit ribosomal protein S18